jgi:putative transposase
MWYYRSCKDDSEVEKKLAELADKLPTSGFWKYYGRIRNEGLQWNHKRVRRVYMKMNLNVRRKRKRRVLIRERQELKQSAHPNQSWSMDFMHDSLESGRKVRLFNVIDDYNREALAIAAATSFAGEQVVRELENIAHERGYPQSLRCDNGPEFTSDVLLRWCEKKNIKLNYIQPGKPVQNAYIERFNGSLRRDVLDAYIFTDLEQIRIATEQWLDDYNHQRPHDALNGESPIPYRLRRASTLSIETSSMARVEDGSNYEKSYF